MPYHLLRLASSSPPHLFFRMNALFGRAFEMTEAYLGKPPSQDYRERLLADERVVMLVALDEGRESDSSTVIGALVAYELPKFEQERSEFYIYDLAVDEAYRRKGIATALIKKTVQIAKERSGWVVYVQADKGDEPAIALYRKLGNEENVLHFDITVD